jgi:hypothetical protein
MNVQNATRVACARFVNVFLHRGRLTMSVDEETEHRQAGRKGVRIVTPDYTPFRPVYAEFHRIQLLSS